MEERSRRKSCLLRRTPESSTALCTAQEQMRKEGVSPKARGFDMTELLKDIDGNTVGYEIAGHRYFYADLIKVKPKTRC